jgi:hypothetical protein
MLLFELEQQVYTRNELTDGWFLQESFIVYTTTSYTQQNK